MSTGIGRHKFNKDNTGNQILVICPYCEYDKCDADWVDIGIGYEQCGPYYCDNCLASEISSLDKRELTEIENKTGWYEPHTAPSEVANTINGKLVNHEVASFAYKLGILDKK